MLTGKALPEQWRMARHRLGSGGEACPKPLHDLRRCDFRPASSKKKFELLEGEERGGRGGYYPTGESGDGLVEVDLAQAHADEDLEDIVLGDDILLQILLLEADALVDEFPPGARARPRAFEEHVDLGEAAGEGARAATVEQEEAPWVQQAAPPQGEVLGDIAGRCPGHRHVSRMSPWSGLKDRHK